MNVFSQNIFWVFCFLSFFDFCEENCEILEKNMSGLLNVFSWCPEEPFVGKAFSQNNYTFPSFGSWAWEKFQLSEKNVHQCCLMFILRFQRKIFRKTSCFRETYKSSSFLDFETKFNRNFSKGFQKVVNMDICVSSGMFYSKIVFFFFEKKYVSIVFLRYLTEKSFESFVETLWQGYQNSILRVRRNLLRQTIISKISSSEKDCD